MYLIFIFDFKKQHLYKIQKKSLEKLRKLCLCNEEIHTDPEQNTNHWLVEERRISIWESYKATPDNYVNWYSVEQGGY